MRIGPPTLTPFIFAEKIRLLYIDIHSYVVNLQHRPHHSEYHQMSSTRTEIEKPSFAFLRIYCKFGLYGWFSSPLRVIIYPLFSSLALHQLQESREEEK